MLTAIQLMIFGFILGGPLAAAGLILLTRVVSKDMNGVYSRSQTGYEQRSIERKRALICLLLGLGIIVLSMIPLISG